MEKENKKYKKSFFFKKYENYKWDIKEERERDRRIVDSFNYAIEGLTEAIRNEKHMKVHILVAIIVVILAILTNSAKSEIMIISVSVSFVMITELINTSVEA